MKEHKRKQKHKCEENSHNWVNTFLKSLRKSPCWQLLHQSTPVLLDWPARLTPDDWYVVHNNISIVDICITAPDIFPHCPESALENSIVKTHSHIYMYTLKLNGSKKDKNFFNVTSFTVQTCPTRASRGHKFVCRRLTWKAKLAMRANKKQCCKHFFIKCKHI